MMRRRIGFGGAALAALALAGCGHKHVKLTAEQSCLIGAYRFADGHVIDIGPSEGADLRWRTDDGRVGRLHADKGWAGDVGWTETPDPVKVAFAPCGHGSLSFAEPGQAPQTATRIGLPTRDIHFKSGDVTLFGRLVMPEGDGPAPVMVEVHGSEKDAASLYNFTQRLYPAQGVGVFVYDKRGTGGSTGTYTQDFNILAQDAAAAARAARSLAGTRIARLGFDGGSQGGWVAPLAATLTPVDFIIVGYGLAVSPLEEDREEIMQELEAKHYGPDILAKASEVVDATDAVMLSGFKDTTRFDAVRSAYGKEPWFKVIQGDFSGQMLRYPGWAVRILGPFLSVHTPWRYDPMPVLRRVKAPILWVLAGEDTQAPIPETKARLLALAAEGRPITMLEFPDTDHGIVEFVVGKDGERASTRYADGYFRSNLDWAKTGKLTGWPYGRAVQLTAREAPAQAAK